jgi:ATP synthase protein I
MAQRPLVPTHSEIPDSRGDAWHAFGALVAGVLVYGLIGWALDRWLGTSFLVVVGILMGAGLGIFMTWKRFIAPQ